LQERLTAANERGYVPVRIFERHIEVRDSILEVALELIDVTKPRFSRMKPRLPFQCLVKCPLRVAQVVRLQIAPPVFDELGVHRQRSIGHT
jgi:hypothetical protein